MRSHRPRRPLRALVAPLLAALLGACDGPPSSAPAGPCPFLDDGECDEPVNCPLGSDEVDCADACALPSHLYGAACAHRREPDTAAPGPSQPPEGPHLVGHQDGTLNTPTPEGTLEPRHYRLYVPATYDPARPSPLVVVMAGHRVDHYGLAGSTELLRSADAHRAILVFAEQPWRWDSLRYAWWTDWNWQTRPDDNPDVIFLRRLVEHLAGQLHVDPARVYATGHSRGGAMALIAALELPEVFAGATIQSGFTEFGYDDRLRTRAPELERRPALVFVHGVLDPDVCIDCTAGGVCGVDPSRGCGDVEASDSLVEQLRGLGWSDDELVYHRLEGVTHRWQATLNDVWLSFLLERPRDTGEVTP